MLDRDVIRIKKLMLHTLQALHVRLGRTTPDDAPILKEGSDVCEVRVLQGFLADFFFMREACLK